METVAKSCKVKGCKRTWSHFQKAIYKAGTKGVGNILVPAVPGAGKTTTAEHLVSLLPADKYVVLLAFNVSIAGELKKRIPNSRYRLSSTVNGLGYRTLVHHLGIDFSRIQIDENKTWEIMKRYMEKEDVEAYGSGLVQLISLAKGHGIVPQETRGTGLMMDTEQNWAALIDKYDVDFEGVNAKPERAIDLARKILEASIRMARYDYYIDFNDQVYLPVIWQAKFSQAHYLITDESQDMNPTDRAMMRMILLPGVGRLIAVGDPNQSIFGFRGADSESMENIKKEFNATEMHLSICYRCTKSIVKEAQQFYSIIEPSPTAEEGKPPYTVEKFNETLFESTDTILCRLNAPLISMAYKLIRKKRACKVLGRKIGTGLISLVKKMNAANVDDLIDRLEVYVEREVLKFEAKGKEQQAQAVRDRVDTVNIFIEQLTEDNRTIDGLIQAISDLFADSNVGMITLSTIHRAKGREWDRVFILDPQLMPSPWARQEWQQKQEKNIQFVAVTRAKKELAYIKLDNWQDKLEAEKEKAAI